MRLTTKSEYSLLSLIYMARRPDKAFIKIDAICKEYGLSKKYLEYIFSILKHARYVRTKRGSKGGYTLAKPAEKITVAEIIRLMDGALAPTLAVSKYFYSHTPIEKEKRVMKIFKEIRDYISYTLETTAVSDLL